ncbi:hypothetical protein SUGI_0486230 [Cryptomeria japonica]|nr:hypothetical protein SUGI_0486230 [Cryptomeria japonica]
MASKTENNEEISFKALQELVKPHIDSFNYFAEEGLETAVSNIRSVVVQQPGTLSKLRNILCILYLLFLLLFNELTNPSQYFSSRAAMV